MSHTTKTPAEQLERANRAVLLWSQTPRNQYSTELCDMLGESLRAALEQLAASQAAPAAAPAGYLLRWLDSPDSAQWYPCERSARDAQPHASGRTEIVAISAAAPAAAPAISLTDELMDCVDRLGSEADTVDPRVWPHMLAYAPKPQPMTDERIKDIYVKNHWYELGEFTWGACSVVVRTIERELRGAAAPADTAAQEQQP